MRLSEIENLLRSSGLPVVYNAWQEGAAPPLPWICYTEGDSNNFYADGTTYEVIGAINVELYSRHKSPSLELRLQQILAPYCWSKSDGIYVESEKLYITTYNIEVLING